MLQQIQLLKQIVETYSYNSNIGAEYGSRTRLASLEGWNTTAMPTLHKTSLVLRFYHTDELQLVQEY